MLNLANPAATSRWWRLPAKGVGLARMEFIVGSVIKAHPMALVRFHQLEDREARRRIEALTRGYADKAEYFVDTLARGVARIAAPFHPHPVILRLSDFKSNEYAHLIGGPAYEPQEENPMIGFRGASRYRSPDFAAAFALECEAIRQVFGPDVTPSQLAGVTEVELRRLADAFGAWFEVPPPATARLRAALSGTLARWPAT